MRREARAYDLPAGRGCHSVAIRLPSDAMATYANLREPPFAVRKTHVRQRFPTRVFASLREGLRIRIPLGLPEKACNYAGFLKRLLSILSPCKNTHSRRERGTDDGCSGFSRE
jgi:hypothetical protein